MESLQISSIYWPTNQVNTGMTKQRRGAVSITSLRYVVFLTLSTVIDMWPSSPGTLGYRGFWELKSIYPTVAKIEKPCSINLSATPRSPGNCCLVADNAINFPLSNKLLKEKKHQGLVWFWFFCNPDSVNSYLFCTSNPSLMHLFSFALRACVWQLKRSPFAQRLKRVAQLVRNLMALMAK